MFVKCKALFKLKKRSYRKDGWMGYDFLNHCMSKVVRDFICDSNQEPGKCMIFQIPGFPMLFS